MDETSTSYSIIEGQSIIHPPYFDGTNYGYWKRRMNIWIRAQDPRFWSLIQEGVCIPMKPKFEWSDEEYKKIEQNARAINFLFCAVNDEDFSKISTYQSAKQMWDKLQEIYEDKETHICLITRQEDHEVNISNSNDELQDMYDELLEEFTKISQEYSLSKKKVLEQQKEIDILKNENKILGKQSCESQNSSCESCIAHVKDIEELKKDLAKLSSPPKSLNNLLSSQKHSKDKEGVDNDSNKPSGSKNTFVIHKKINKQPQQVMPKETRKMVRKPTREPIRQPQAFRQPRNNRYNEVHWKPPKHASYRYDQTYAHKEPYRPHYRQTNMNRYNEVHWQKPKYASYRKPYRMHNPHVTCHYCSKIGHIAPLCFTKHRHMYYQSQNMRWDFNGQFAHTNLQGPKFTWVPKSKF